MPLKLRMGSTCLSIWGLYEPVVRSLVAITGPSVDSDHRNPSHHRDTVPSAQLVDIIARFATSMSVIIRRGSRTSHLFSRRRSRLSFRSSSDFQRAASPSRALQLLHPRSGPDRGCRVRARITTGFACQFQRAAHVAKARRSTRRVGPGQLHRLSRGWASDAGRSRSISGRSST